MEGTLVEKSKPKRWPGFFIAIEGADGTGKSTLAARLAEALGACEVHEPQTPGLAPAIRQGLAGDLPLDAWELMALFVAERICNLHTVILPKLRDGGIVIADRYVRTTLVYQGLALGHGSLDGEWMRSACSRWPEPDLTFVLDLDPRLALARSTHDGRDIDPVDADTFLQDCVRMGFRRGDTLGPTIVLSAEMEVADLVKIAMVEVERRVSAESPDEGARA